MISSTTVKTYFRSDALCGWKSHLTQSKRSAAASRASITTLTEGVIEKFGFGPSVAF